MSNGGTFHGIARKYCTYTGESFAFVKNEVSIDRAAPIPVPTTDQMRLEAMVFRQLADRGLSFPHAAGIARVRLLPVRTPVIYLDHVGSGLDELYPSRRTVTESVLPVAEPGIQVDGVIGLRVVNAEGCELTVGWLGTDARLVLRATGKVPWRNHLQQRARELRYEYGCVPLWDEPKLTSHEHEHIDTYGWRPVDSKIAWLGSALLRRIGTLNTISNAYSTRVWTTHDSWVVETSTRRDVPLSHTELMCWLADPVWGAGLQLRKCSCECRADSLYDTSCRFYLDGLGDRFGCLQLRCHHERHSNTIEPRQTLNRVTAPAAWLNRVLPEPSGPDALDTPELKNRRLQWLKSQAHTS